MNASIVFQSIFLNNEGVEHVRHGCSTKKSVESFTRALHILRSLLDDRCNSRTETKNPLIDEQSEAMDVDSDVLGDLIFISMSHSDSVEEEQRRRSSANDGEHHRVWENFFNNKSSCETNARYVFQDPIKIPLMEVDQNLLSRGLLYKLTNIVMYNLALSFHLHGLQRNCVDSLIRAQYLYELAFQLHVQECCDVTLLFSLALLNNLGLIYRTTKEIKRSNACFQHMLSTMMYLLECNEAGTIKQWEGLMSNVMDFALLHSDIVAAAA